MKKNARKKVPVKPGKPARKKPPTATGKIPSPIVLGKILVPIDFSEYSKKALQYAVPFAKQFNAKIYLLYVVEPTVYPADFSFGQIGMPNVENELRVKGGEELQELIKNEIKGIVPAEALVKVGLPFVEVVSFAKDEAIELIIVATHGHTGVEHVLFGSTAEKIVRKAPCPVLVVRAEERDFVDERV
ncbi:MAG TPA: universal stress protein [Bacteroidota bacterium]|nr:universal stress protein [Bacteroidota bacterium]